MSALGGKVAVVTGATGGMGRVMVRELHRAGIHVIAVARNAERLNALRSDLATEAHLDPVETVAADLSLRSGILDASESIRKRHDSIHILINNAGAHFNDRRVTVDGLEMHVAVNFLTGYGMTRLLADSVRRGGARVVNVSSDTIRDTRRVKLLGPARPSTVETRELHDLTLVNGAQNFVAFEAYARAKLLTVMAGYELAREFADDGVTVNSVHPGIVATEIIDGLIPAALRPFRRIIERSMLTPDEGAASALHLAMHPGLQDVTGRYFVRDVETLTPDASYDRDAQAQLLRSARGFLGTPLRYF